jgi:hypothetical protein
MRPMSEGRSSQTVDPHHLTQENLMQTLTAPNTTSTRIAGRSRLVVVGAAAVTALAGWVILSPLAGIDLQARQGTVVHIGAISVVVTSAVAALAGWGLLAIMERRTAKARDIWTVIATIVCVVSTSSPLDRGVDLGSKLGLASLHLLVGAVVVIGLRRTLAVRERC